MFTPFVCGGYVCILPRPPPQSQSKNHLKKTGLPVR